MLNTSQLDALLAVFRDGAVEASRAWSRWVGRHAEISVQRVEQLEMQDAVAVLGSTDEPTNACIMTIAGCLSGCLILAFDDASGWGLADLLIEQAPGTANSWGEMEQSAVLETGNIVGSAYLNALSRLFQQSGESLALLPSPPQFVRDFASSILESTMLNQAMASSTIFLTETTFHLEDSPSHWNLLFVPDADSLPTLQRMLA